MSPIILVGAGILVFGLGLGLGYWLSGRQAATKAGDIQHELDEYRRHVTEHFSETAQHFQELGKQYQSLYKHMATGAEALCDPAQTDAMLEFPAGATAVLAASDSAAEAEHQPIRDYAPEDSTDARPGEAVREEMTAEEADAPESVADVDAADAAPVESVAEEEIAEAITPATPDETERTVH